MSENVWAFRFLLLCQWIRRTCSAYCRAIGFAPLIARRSARARIDKRQKIIGIPHLWLADTSATLRVSVRSRSAFRSRKSAITLSSRSEYFAYRRASDRLVEANSSRAAASRSTAGSMTTCRRSRELRVRRTNPFCSSRSTRFVTEAIARPEDRAISPALMGPLRSRIPSTL
jgi:hypothetical protein